MNYASKSQAENGTDNTTVMTPLRTKQAIQANSSSSPGGTTNYNDLTNKPKINNVELSGNKTSANLGLQPTLVSGTNIKTVNNTSLLGSGNVSVQSTLVSGTNIKTINNTSLLGSGNITIEGGKTYYFDGQNNAANLAMINEICHAFDNGDEINFTGKFADYATGQIFQAPINVVKYDDGTGSYDSTFNNEAAFISDPVLWVDPDSWDPTQPTIPADYYYLTFALLLEGTWGNYTSVGEYRRDTMSPKEWNDKQDKLVSGTNIKTVNNNSLLGSGNISISTANNRRGFFGTCSTAAATAAKVVTLSDTSGWELKAGTIVGVKFTNTNTASNVTLNVNSTGAKSIYGGNAVYTGTNWQLTGGANYIHYYMYDGTYWVFLNVSNNIYNDSNTYTSAYCTTAAGTAAKTASCTNYSLLSKSYLHVIITNSNTSASALTFNVNGKGAKPIYINGSASSSSNYTLPAGSYIVYYDGTNYYFRTDGKLTASITGNIATADVATKLGTSTVGGTNRPIYLNSGTATQCNTPESGNWFRGIPYVSSGGVTEVGRYLDFHPTNASTLDYSKRIDAGTGTTARVLTLPDKTGTLACTSDIPTLPSTTTGTGIVTRSSGGTLNASNYAKYGNVVNLHIQITSPSSSTAVGSNVFTGTINNSAYYPKVNTNGVSYQSSSGIIGYIETSGAITIRVVGAALAASKQFNIGFTYVV